MCRCVCMCMSVCCLWKGCAEFPRLADGHVLRYCRRIVGIAQSRLPQSRSPYQPRSDVPLQLRLLRLIANARVHSIRARRLILLNKSFVYIVNIYKTVFTLY